MLTDMKVFNDQLKGAIIERLTQNSEAFNAASGGTILLQNAGNMGDFSQTSFWNNVASAIRDADAYAANGDVAATALTQGIFSTVKAMKAFGPIKWEPNQITWIKENPATALRVISQSLAEGMMQAQLNRAIAVAAAAISNVATLTNDVSATAGVSQATLNATHALYGDASQQLIAQIMTGAVYHKLIGQNITNTNQLFQAGNVTVVDILGKRTIVTDSPALRVAGTPNKNRVLCLTAGAVKVEPNGDFNSVIDETAGVGKVRLETMYQAEWTENVGLKGFTWDEVNGGRSPVTAELETGSNWDKVWADKLCAGVILIGDEAKD
ncbi:major capsid protein [Pseudomonas sp.]|uniref:major capsid protein n=1 Tax=Pseudomonas sp. TaxID=306 RepID=UPI0019E4671D|nr:major capsid protein [Pseudomonas sp.]MBF0675584.1 hypothetical protein [Pseudomonas sp.]